MLNFKNFNFVFIFLSLFLIFNFFFWGGGDLQTLHIPTNKRFGHNTGYVFLSLLATSLLSRKFYREKSQACTKREYFAAMKTFSRQSICPLLLMTIWCHATPLRGSITKVLRLFTWWSTVIGYGFASNTMWLGSQLSLSEIAVLMGTI